MLREIIVPEAQDYTVHLPAEYINHKVEIIAFPIDLTDDTTSKKRRAGLGCLKGKITMSDDFDEPLDDFKDYM